MIAIESNIRLQKHQTDILSKFQEMHAALDNAFKPMREDMAALKAKFAVASSGPLPISLLGFSSKFSESREELLLPKWLEIWWMVHRIERDEAR